MKDLGPIFQCRKLQFCVRDGSRSAILPSVVISRLDMWGSRSPLWNQSQNRYVRSVKVSRTESTVSRAGLIAH